MHGAERKAAISAYKERKVLAGIFAVRCGASGQCWIGRAPDLTTIRNRIWFMLRMGNATCPSLQAAWRTHGEDAFGFEVVEQIEDEEDAYIRGKLLKARQEHWCSERGATAI